jgi:hypothetical protein
MESRENDLDDFRPFPDDVWIHCILPSLSLKDIANIRLVSKAASKIATDETVWQDICSKMPFVGSEVAAPNERWWHAAKRYTELGEVGRYAIFAGFPSNITEGLGLRNVHGVWMRVSPPNQVVHETTLGIMTAEKFIHEMPRTPPQWIQAYTSVFNICGNKHSRVSSLPDGCDWQARISSRALSSSSF